VQVACFMFKVRHNELPVYFTGMFKINSNVHVYSTRHADDYHISFSRTNIFKNTIRNTGPVLWNSIDSNIKLLSNINIFKCAYKQHVLTEN
jgi:hypothetical protein